MFGKAIVRGFVAAAIVSYAVVAQASVNIELVSVGNPGNTGEWSGGSYGGYGPDRICGAVDYSYLIGKYEVTAGQYTEFLNAKAAVTDTYGLYNADMHSSYGCRIQRTPVSGGYTYSVASDYANRPVNYVSYWDAARFANWMHNGQGDGDIDTGAYTLGDYNGVDGRTITRNPGAKWFLPSEDEWYKAAYHKNDGVTSNYFDYPTGSDTTPGRDMADASGNNANYVGSPYPIDSPYYTTLAGEFQLSDSLYGTFDQGGNVWEWNEAVVWESGSLRGLRGGAFYNGARTLLASNRNFCYSPSIENYVVGFRVASVPEPGSLVVWAGIALTALLYHWRKHV